MIFVTDLDRTLIYSHLFLETADCEYALIEKKGDKPIAYMSKKAITLLKAVNQKVHMIPISLRNEEEFGRIQLFKGEGMPELFVLNNGGAIYYKGEKDQNWQQQMNLQMAQMPYTHEVVKNIFLRTYTGTIEKIIDCGGLGWLFVGKRDQIKEEDIQKFANTYERDGLRISLSGRKIYIYPYFISKWQAVCYIKEHYFKPALEGKTEKVMAAGDAFLDMEMVEKADYGIIPKECYIEKQVKDHVKITKHSGMRAAEDILEAVLQQAEQK